MGSVVVPCPDCGEPIELGLWDFGLSKRGRDGTCAACAGGYRFAATVRFAGFVGTVAVIVLAMVTAELLRRCVACRALRDLPVSAFGPLLGFATVLFAWMLLSALTMRAAARSLLARRRVDEVLIPVGRRLRHGRGPAPAAPVDGDRGIAGRIVVVGGLALVCVAAATAVFNQWSSGAVVVGRSARATFERSSDPAAFWSCILIELSMAILAGVAACRILWRGRG
jgi:hypothetical protein